MCINIFGVRGQYLEAADACDEHGYGADVRVNEKDDPTATKSL